MQLQRERYYLGSGFEGPVHHGGKVLLVGATGSQEAENNCAEDAFFYPVQDPSLGNDSTYFNLDKPFGENSSQVHVEAHPI